MGRKNRRKTERTSPLPDELLVPVAIDYGPGDWFILRMASADTLRIADVLMARGLKVWTPSEIKIGRTPRVRAKYEKRAPIMPSYVFARFDDLDEILRLAMLPAKECGRFSVFHHKGGIPLIADHALSALRHEETRLAGIIERQKRRGKKGPVFSAGANVKPTEGPFAGLSGVVEGTQGQFTLVSFAGFHAPIKIASFHLHPGVVDCAPIDAAQAA